jgi:flavodoxin
MAKRENKATSQTLRRREFLYVSTMATAGILLAGCGETPGVYSTPADTGAVVQPTISPDDDDVFENGRQTMETLIVYDTQHGNTKQVAEAMGKILGCAVRPATEVNSADLEGVVHLVVGSPTHGGQMTEPVLALLKSAPSLEGVKVAAFDTRTEVFINKLLPWGYAAPKIAKRLTACGGTLVAEPEGFIVLGMEGPLQEGELARAAAWAEKLTA